MGRATSTARQSHLFRDHIMLTIRQSPFDLFERLEQQLATAERVPNAEILDNKETYIVRLELPGVDRDSIDIKATDRNLVISAERPQPNQSDDSEPLLSEFRSGIWSRKQVKNNTTQTSKTNKENQPKKKPPKKTKKKTDQNQQAKSKPPKP